MSIVEISDKTLRRIEQNDPKLTFLSIVNRGHTVGGHFNICFWLHDSADVSRLGDAIVKIHGDINNKNPNRFIR